MSSPGYKQGFSRRWWQRRSHPSRRWRRSSRRAIAVGLTVLVTLGVIIGLGSVTTAWGQTPAESPRVAPAAVEPQTGGSLKKPWVQYEAEPPRDRRPQPRWGNPLGQIEPENGRSPFAATPFNVYRLGPGDSIFLSVQRFPDLSGQVTLDIEGNVILPILGALPLEGLTLSEAQERIRFAYDRYVINPDVTLTLVAQRPVQVTIVGEVARPGFYPLPAPQVSTAILSAGGTLQTADLRQVKVQRRLPDGTLLEETVDLFTPLRDATALPNLRLQHDDVIIVERLDPTEAIAYDQALVASSTIAQPEINVRVLSYAGRRIGNLVLPNGSRFVDALVAIGPDPDTADLGDVGLVRFDPESGQAITLELDGKDALRGDITQNPPLADNDVIIVGRNFIGRVTYALGNFTQPFRDVLGFLLFFESLQEGASNLFGP